MRIAAQVEGVQAEVAALRGFRAAVGDRQPLLRIFGVLMVASMQRTFRDEGSPAGSWAPLAASTLRKKGYTSGHKLLVMRGRLFRSLGSEVVGDDAVEVGSRGIPYAAVQNFGSADQMASVGEHGGHYTKALRYKLVEVKGADGKTYKVPRAQQHSRAQGPKQRIDFRVAAHQRRQNIPARPFAVLRPEDPQRLTDAAESYFRGQAQKAGKVTAI